MDDGFASDVEHEKDPATMVAELGQRLDRETLARAIGVEPAELDLIGAGHAPTKQAAERLRLLYELSKTTDDLEDPGALLAGAGDGRRSMLPLALVPRLKRYAVAFVLVDALVFVGFTVALLLFR